MKYLLLSLLLAFVCIAKTQETDQYLFKLRSVNSSFGIQSLANQPYSLEDFKKLAPESSLLKSDFKGFNYFPNLSNTGANFNLHLSFSSQTKDGKTRRLNPELQIGLSYSFLDLGERVYNRNETFRVDTLVSKQTGEEYFIDSSSNEQYDFRYSQKEIYLDIAYLISSNSVQRFKFFGGLGASIGISIDPRTELNYFQFDSTEGGTTSRTTSDQSGGNFKNESYSNKNALLARLYISAGADYRIGNKDFWERCHLFIQTQGIMQYRVTPKLGTHLNTANVSSLGVRFDF